MADIFPSARCGKSAVVHLKHVGSCVGDSSRNMVTMQ